MYMCLMVYPKAKPKSCANNQLQKEMKMSKQKMIYIVIYDNYIQLYDSLYNRLKK